MIKGDFVIRSLQRWDIPIGSNIKDIALEISKNNRVLYVNTPNGSCKEPIITQIVKDRLWVLELPIKMLPIGSLPDGFLFDLANRYNQMRFYKRVNKVIQNLGFKDFTFIIDNDIYNSFYAVELLKPKFSIYYRRDNMVKDYWARHAPRLEPLLAAKCSCIMANTQILADMLKSANSHRFDIGQGVDLDSYIGVNCVIADDVRNIPRPIVGYTGNIVSNRLDADLLYDVATKMPDCSFVMVGTEDDYFVAHKLHSLSNVYFLGHRPNESMPQYISSFDVCINPQKLNVVTMGNYPRKIDEYLAMGKPVVATKTDAMKMFDGFVYCCDGVSEWVESLKEALNDKNCEMDVEKRIEFAQSHSWSHCVSKLYGHIEELL